MNKKMILLLISYCYIVDVMAADYFVNPQSSAASWVEKNKSDSRAELINKNIATVPTAIWLSSIQENEFELTQQIANYISQANKQQTELMFVLYGLPNRDCSGQASADNRADKQKYKTWIDILANSIATTKVTIILEPDALADIDCLTQSQREERISLINYAVSHFKTQSPNVHVYLDAGNMQWVTAKNIAKKLMSAGIKNAYGFSLNISNYHATDSTIKYGNDINQYLTELSNIHSNMIIDTSRNGNGSSGLPNDWCNSTGRKIGNKPMDISATIKTAWIKPPGESDGDFSPSANCHGGPKAGVFSPDLAIKLIKGK